MAENLDKGVSTIMSSMENFISAKTIVGEPIQYKDIIVFPMADVSFGVASGSFSKEGGSKSNAASGAGARLTPSAVLIIQNGTSKVVNIKDRDSINKLIDMIPDLINKLTEKLNERPRDEKPKPHKPRKNEKIDITDFLDFEEIN